MKVRISHLFASCLLAVGLGQTGCVAPASKAPIPSTDVNKIEAWRDAESVSERETDRATVIGTGDSMRPIYGDRTVLVLSKIDYTELKAGMQVAYLNQRDQRVVHVLVKRDAWGWRVKGLNNDNEDQERVTPGNLIGVVYASFATDADEK